MRRWIFLGSPARHHTDDRAFLMKPIDVTEPSLPPLKAITPAARGA
jgi:hypothetical protein